jgi:hypothetical protein
MWLLGLVVALLGAYYSYELGWMHVLWEVDASKLSFLNILFFFASYLYLGFCFAKNTVIDEFEMEVGDYFSNASINMGLLGTVIGFIIMASTLSSGIDFQNIEEIKGMIAIATHGLSVAFYTTGSGIISSYAISTIYFLVERYADGYTEGVSDES